MSGGGLRFGPYRLDPGAKALQRHADPIVITRRQFALLLEFVTHPGDVVTKHRLMDIGWRDVAVTPNNLVQAVRQLRQLLDAAEPDRYITTESRLGYRFVATVSSDDPSTSETDFDDVMAPHRALIDGRALLETLEQSRIRKAIDVFEALVARDGRQATFHVGLANACVLHYESTRADARPDVDALRRAVTHAREARRLAPDYAEAWATLGFVLERSDARLDAVAALRQAVLLEPNSWHHQLRLAYGTWGEERLRAAQRVLELWPGLPTAHLLAATVFIARGALVSAERELDAARANLPNSTSSPRVPLVAIHWLRGLLFLARGADDDALASFERELALEPRGHLYARECCASAWYAKGAIAWRHGDADAARAAFEQAIARVPGHPMARAGLAMPEGKGGDRVAVERRDDASPVQVDVAMAHAVGRVKGGDATGGAAMVSAALDAAPPGNAGWLLPVDPLLGVQREPAAWAGALAALRARAGLWLVPVQG